MKILKSLNKKIFTVLLAYLIFLTLVFAEEKPIDIWNIEKKDTQVILETNISSEEIQTNKQNSVYELQTKKKKIQLNLIKIFHQKKLKLSVYTIQVNTA